MSLRYDIYYYSTIKPITFTSMVDISILIPCYNESKSINLLLRELEKVCSPLIELEWQLLFVDDGSSDDTAFILNESIIKHTSWCKSTVIELSRNFGKEAALIAGLDHCNTEACIIMDADLQDPPYLIPKMIEEWQNGASVVSAKRAERDSDNYAKKVTAKLFYKIFKITSKLNIEVDASDFRLIDRTVIKAIRSCRESVRFSKGFFAWAGFRNTTVTYKRPKREAGQTKWGNWKLWNYALDGIFSFSTAPLRIWTYCGMAITLVSFLFTMRVVILLIFDGILLPGYASLFTAITLLGGIQLIGIGIIGEYLGRTYIESKRRPLYLIRNISKSSNQGGDGVDDFTPRT